MEIVCQTEIAFELGYLKRMHLKIFRKRQKNYR